ncbi:MAG: Ig-like domain-containing protein [Gemmatimonadales bacterium]
MTSAPVVARVEDSDGRPVPAATVNWSVPAGTATVAPSTSVADDSGIVRTTLTMGTGAGVVYLRGSIARTSIAVYLAASALPGPLFILTPGFTDLSLPVNTPFGGTIHAIDSLGNPIPGLLLKTRSDGFQYALLPTPAMSPSSAVTNANGDATFASVTAAQPGMQYWLIDGPGTSAWFRVRAAGSRGFIGAWNGTPSAGRTWKIGSAEMEFGFIVTQADGFPAGNMLLTFTLAPGNGTFGGGSAGGVFDSTFFSGLTTVKEGLGVVFWRPPAVPGTYSMTVQSPAPNDVGSPLVATVTVIP